MSSTPSHMGDVGTVFEQTIVDQDGQVVDISAATVMEITFQRPDGASFTRAAERSTDGTDGKMRYVTAAEDLDAFGTWWWQGRVVLTTGQWHTDVHEFEVEANR